MQSDTNKQVVHGKERRVGSGRANSWPVRLVRCGVAWLGVEGNLAKRISGPTAQLLANDIPCSAPLCSFIHSLTHAMSSLIHVPTH